MTESTLSGGYAELSVEIAHYLGWTRTSSSWSTDQEATIAMILKRGLRQFYFPPAVGQVTPHQWSFLAPVVEIDTVAPYSTGTIAITLAGTTVTLTTGVWPSWAYTHGSLIVDTTEYTIASRTDDTHIELDNAWTAATETAATYTLRHDGNYDLPDDFGGIEGAIVVESSNYKPEIDIIGEGKIRQLRQTSYSSGTPYWAATRPKEHTVTTTGQRFEVLFYPTPDSVITMSYVKRILPQMLVDTTLEYPYGGSEHSETILASCLAIAEEQEDDKRGLKYENFKERLAASIAIDNQKNSPDYYGYNRDNSDAVHRDDNTHRRRQHWGDNLVSYDS